MKTTKRFFSLKPQRRYVRTLDQVDDVQMVGGKGHSLQQLRDLGAPVPDALILTTEFCKIMRDKRDGSSALALPIVDEIQKKFGPDTLIVRSSAVGEDGQTAAFAGLLESIFPVDATDRRALENAIRDCVESSQAHRVIAYERARGVRLGGMAVVVQRLIESSAAGVLFTDGVTLRGEWCRGFGQTLVDGAITPGAFRLDRRFDRPAIIERPSEDGSDFPLDTRASATLVQYAMALERRRGVALDIEWCVDAAGHLFIVQARPVTHKKTYLFSNANISENFPTPVVPLLASFAGAGYDAYFRNLAREFGISEDRITANDAAFRNIVEVHGARLYYNLSHIHAVLRLMPFGDSLVHSFDTFVGSGTSQSEGHDVPDELISLFRVSAHIVRAYHDLPRRIERFERRIDEIAARYHPRRLAAMSRDELAEGLQSILDIRLRHWLDASLADCAAAVTYRALQSLLKRQTAEDPARHHVLLEGLDVAGAWSLRALWNLALAFRADENACVALGHAAETNSGGFAVFYDALDTNLRLRVDDWLDRYGFRGSGELLLTEPSLAEEPDRLLPILHRYVQSANNHDDLAPDAGFERQMALREKMTARYRNGFTSYLRPIFDWLVSATQASVKFRERARFRQALLYSRLRAVALACGRTLVTTGTLEKPVDVFYFSMDELRLITTTNGVHSGQTPRHLVMQRRERHDALATLDMPDVFTLPAGVEVTEKDFPSPPGPANPVPHQGALVGVPASAGRVNGRAAVLDGLTDANRLQRGDVLVARQTDPGWAPLFFLVRGLVLERGGMLSHGSILARELGIPSVVGVQQATTRIAHGTNIIVDGDAGHVQIT